MRRWFIVGFGFVSVALLLLAATETPQAQAPADLVLINGRVLTVDANDSVAQAVAIASGRIVAVRQSLTQPGQYQKVQAS